MLPTKSPLLIYTSEFPPLYVVGSMQRNLEKNESDNLLEHYPFITHGNFMKFVIWNLMSLSNDIQKDNQKVGFLEKKYIPIRDFQQRSVDSS